MLRLDAALQSVGIKTLIVKQAADAQPGFVVTVLGNCESRYFKWMEGGVEPPHSRDGYVPGNVVSRDRMGWSVTAGL